MQTIPLIDLSTGSDTVREIEKASRDIGFMYVIGHGIAADTIANARTAVVDYFSLPMKVKIGDRITRDNYRGYIPPGFFSANSGDGDADNYEGYKLHFDTRAQDPICEVCDLYGPNRWPDQPASFEENLAGYWRECDRVADVLLRAFARIMGTEPERFMRMFDAPLTNMTLLHYPPGESGFGIHPHKDTDVLTILANDPVGGLMVRRRDESGWIEADPPNDALVVNIGDMLELWSGGYFISTPHKVVNRSGAERYSFPYFVVPRFDTVVEPMMQPQPGFERAEIHVGDISREVWRSNWPDKKIDSNHLQVTAVEH